LKFLVIFCFLLMTPLVSFGQAAIPPQLKNLLDFYFRGAGSSNSVDRIQIKDGAINLAKLDTGVGGIYQEIASIVYVNNTFLPLTSFGTYTQFVNSTYLTQANAASTYLTQSSAASTYLTQSSAASTYLTQSSAASTYLTQSSAASTYATKSEVTALSNNVNSTYATKIEVTALSNNVNSTYATKSEVTALSNNVNSTYATKSEVNTLSNHVNSTFVSNSFLNGYFSGTVDVVNVSTTNRFVFEKGLLKTHTLFQ
jgi:hypothetical protein